MRTLSTLILCAGVGALSALLGGCTASPAEVIRFTDSGVPYVIEMQDYRVRTGLSVVSVSSTMAGDLPLAIVQLRNTTATELRFDVQFTWTTAEGRVLADQGHMMRGQHVGPGATISLQNAAGRADAQRFKLKLRSAK